MLAWICCGGLVDGFDSVTVHTSNRFQHVALCSFKSVIFWAILLDLRWVFWDFTDLGSSISARVQELNESNTNTLRYTSTLCEKMQQKVYENKFERVAAGFAHKIPIIIILQLSHIWKGNIARFAETSYGNGMQLISIHDTGICSWLQNGPSAAFTAAKISARVAGPARCKVLP